MTLSGRLKARAPEVLLLLSLGLCLFRLDLSWFNTHMARDLFRADLWAHFQPADWSGPEMGWDVKRLPGPFYYWLLAGLSLLGSIQNILAAKIVLTYVFLRALLLRLQKNFSSGVVLVFTLLFAFMPVFILTTRNLWNPSVIIIFNAWQLLTFLKFKEKPAARWLIISAAIAAAGLTVHFSTFIVYLAFTFAVLPDPRFRKIQLGLFVPFLLWLGAWALTGPVTEFGHQLSQFYGSNHFLLNRLEDLKYHLTLSLLELKDYDLFTLLFKSMEEMGLIAGNFVISTASALGWIYLALLAGSLWRILLQYRREKSFFDLYLLLHCAFFFISILALRNKENIPYRYGLCFYPVQFLVIAYGVSLMNKKIYPLLGGLAALTCAFYIYFDCKMLQAQALTGRAHHTQVDNLELTYGHKSEVYGFLKLHGENGEARAGDPFQLLHGRTANKIRLKEMNWEQKTPYFMLARESGLGFSYDPGVRDLAPPEKSWILHAANLSELKAGKSPLSFDELKKEQLPRNLRITYLKNGSALATANWNNTGLILPMAFYKDVYLADEIRLEFEVDAGKYLNLLLDDNDNYRFAYANVYQLQSVKINGNGLAPETIFRGAFLVQNQYSYNFPESPARVEIILKPVFKYMNFSRVDLFTTDAPPVREELLTPESGIF